MSLTGWSELGSSTILKDSVLRLRWVIFGEFWNFLGERGRWKPCQLNGLSFHLIVYKIWINQGRFDHNRILSLCCFRIFSNVKAECYMILIFLYLSKFSLLCIKSTGQYPWCTYLNGILMLKFCSLTIRCILIKFNYFTILMK